MGLIRPVGGSTSSTIRDRRPPLTTLRRIRQLCLRVPWLRLLLLLEVSALPCLSIRDPSSVLRRGRRTLRLTALELSEVPAAAGPWKLAKSPSGICRPRRRDMQLVAIRLVVGKMPTRRRCTCSSRGREHWSSSSATCSSSTTSRLRIWSRIPLQLRLPRPMDRTMWAAVAISTCPRSRPELSPRRSIISSKNWIICSRCISISISGCINSRFRCLLGSISSRRIRTSATLV
mmetsp:Transcript_27660/g.60605  ORF Transcript_27660/g.60605 Transcript_27660/m.60605 type:complete len:232 (-) Transcript_27660:1287-1982(-)